MADKKQRLFDPSDLRMQRVWPDGTTPEEIAAYEDQLRVQRQEDAILDAAAEGLGTPKKSRS